VVDLLDGTLTEQQLLRRAVRLGARSGDVRALLTTLHAHGLLVAAHTLTCPPDLRAETAALALSCAGPRAGARAARGHTVANRTPAQIIRARAEARVAIVGRGRLAAPIAVALAGSGVGHVRADLPGEVRPEETVLGLDPTTVGRPRSAAVTAALRGTRSSAKPPPAAPAVTGVRAGTGKPQLIVRVGAGQPVNLATAALRRRGQAVLVVEIRDGIPVIGPFVAAGGSPCLGCLDRHRLDRDPAWPEIAAGLATAPPAEACDLVTIMAATAFAVAEVLAHLDGATPRTTGAAVELVSPGELRWRYWPPHPRCSCGSSRHDLGSP
jgi:bacteriocin biosynthesis cyclodehydratase domain-containing protein